MRKKNSNRGFSKLAYGKEIRNILRMLVIMAETPQLLLLVIERFHQLIAELKEQYAETHQSPVALDASHFIGKNDYVAVVGLFKIPLDKIVKEAANFGFQKRNVRICSDLDAFKNGKYTDLMKSDSCVAVIFGEIPHSHHVDVRSLVKYKSIDAKTKSGKLKFSMESVKTAFADVLELLNRESKHFVSEVNKIKKGNLALAN